MVWMLLPTEKVKLEQKGGPGIEPWGAPGVGGREGEEGAAKKTEKEGSAKREED